MAASIACTTCDAQHSKKVISKDGKKVIMMKKSNQEKLVETCYPYIEDMEELGGIYLAMMGVNWLRNPLYPTGKKLWDKGKGYFVTFADSKMDVPDITKILTDFYPMIDEIIATVNSLLEKTIIELVEREIWRIAFDPEEKCPSKSNCKVLEGWLGVSGVKDSAKDLGDFTK